MHISILLGSASGSSMSMKYVSQSFRSSYLCVRVVLCLFSFFYSFFVLRVSQTNWPGACHIHISWDSVDEFSLLFFLRLRITDVVCWWSVCILFLIYSAGWRSHNVVAQFHKNNLFEVFFNSFHCFWIILFNAPMWLFFRLTFCLKYFTFTYVFSFLNQPIDECTSSRNRSYKKKRCVFSPSCAGKTETERFNWWRIRKSPHEKKNTQKKIHLNAFFHWSVILLGAGMSMSPHSFGWNML